jgi:uncharacterized protein YigE (DUF2233 family)
MEAAAKKRLLLVAMHLLLPALLFYLLLATCRSVTRAGVWRVKKDSHWKELETGLELREAELSFERLRKDGMVARQVTITALRINPRRFSLEAHFNPVRKASSSLDVAREQKAVAAFNGRYFGHKNEPVALLISGGKLLHKRDDKQPYSAVFLLNTEGKAAVTAIKNLKPPYKGVDFAVQNQPLLVYRGGVVFRPKPKPKPKAKPEEKPKTTISNSPGHRRTIAGVDFLGRAVLLICDNPVGLVELASLLSMSEKRGGFGLAAALNLDGGPSSGMAVVHAKSKTEKHVKAGRTIPYLLLIKRRPKPLETEKKKPDAPQGQFVPVRP